KPERMAGVPEDMVRRARRRPRQFRRKRCMEKLNRPATDLARQVLQTAGAGMSGAHESILHCCWYPLYACSRALAMERKRTRGRGKLHVPSSVLGGRHITAAAVGSRRAEAPRALAEAPRREAAGRVVQAAHRRRERRDTAG